MNLIPKFLTDLKDVPATVANKYLKRNVTNDGFEWSSVDPYTSGNLSKRLHYIPKQARAFNLPYYSGKSIGLTTEDLLFAGGYLWGSYYWTNTVYQIDVKTCAILASISVSGASGNLCYDGVKYLWVKSGNGASITKIDTTTSPPQVVATISLGGSYMTSTPVSDGTNIWFGDNNGTVRRINSQDNTITTYPSAIVFPACFDGTYLWGSNNNNQWFYKLNLSFQVVNQGYMGFYMWRGYFDGTHVWMLQSSGTNIWKIDSNMNVTTINLGIQGSSISFDGTHLWVGIQNGIKMVNIVSNVVSTITATGISIPPTFDGSQMWCAVGSTILKLPAK